tara:strand:+ start:249 stop:479 length:231 start_codon:yes stop_codon:yes gene_type:complete
MKNNILVQYLWIFSITAGLLTVALLLLPEKKDQLEYLQKEIEKVQEQQQVLTDKEKELQELATEKEWAEVDKESNK